MYSLSQCYSLHSRQRRPNLGGTGIPSVDTALGLLSTVGGALGSLFGGNASATHAATQQALDSQQAKAQQFAQQQLALQEQAQIAQAARLAQAQKADSLNKLLLIGAAGAVLITAVVILKRK